MRSSLQTSPDEQNSGFYTFWFILKCCLDIRNKKEGSINNGSLCHTGKSFRYKNDTKNELAVFLMLQTISLTEHKKHFLQTGKINKH